ncbi:MAG: peptide-methionine (R)-S-oxide reductase MsrB [Rufibacter sp.]
MLRWKDIIIFAKYGNPEPERRVEKTEAEWRAHLTPAQYQILREKGTESPYRNAYCRSYEPGSYFCVACGNLLFHATAKYHAISGWPSFTQPVTKSAIKYLFDDSHRMPRIEVQCNVCDGHLGHVFPDGPEPFGVRYCINSESLSRIEETPGNLTGGFCE